MKVMHQKYGVNKWFQAEQQSDVEWRRFNKYMAFRLGMMQEELDETKQAFEQKDAPEMVDGIIDLCVFAIGTLEAFGVDANKAIIAFGGGCQGCGMADVTLKQGVEVMIMDNVPEIVEVIDATDHAAGANPFY